MMKLNERDVLLGMFICLNVFLLFRDRAQLEHMSGSSDMEAMQTLSSMYKSGTLKVKNLQVTDKVIGNLNIAGNTDIRGNNTVRGSNTIHGNNVVHGNNETKKNVTVRGDIYTNNKIWVGPSGHEYSIHRDTVGRLQFGNGGKNLVSLPKDAHDTPVFRANGLMYTNKKYPHSNKHFTQLRADTYNHVKHDRDKYENMMFLSGTDTHSSRHHWSVLNIRGGNDGKHSMSQVAIHGHAPACTKPVCSWGDAYI